MTSLLSGSLHVDEEGVLWFPIATVLSPEELWQGVQALADGAPPTRNTRHGTWRLSATSALPIGRHS